MRPHEGRPALIFFINRAPSNWNPAAAPASGVREPDIYCWAGQEWQTITPFPKTLIETRVGWNPSGRIAILAVVAKRVWTAYENMGQWDWSSLPLER